MEPNAIIETLVESGVLQETDDGTAIALVDAFRERVDEYEARLESNSDALRAEIEASPLPDLLGDASAGRHPLYAAYLALDDGTADLDHGAMVGLLPYLDQLRRGEPTREEVPASFVPLQGDVVEPMCRLCDRSIVYIYRDDSAECALMREALDELFPAPPADISLFAVYAPNWREAVREAFDVEYTPATLFVLRGTVDVRLQGAQYVAAIENEIEKLRAARLPGD